jgi:hypothetical protein
MIVLGAVAVGLVMGVRPPHSPPLYDGLGFPDEPYRWYRAPPGADQTPQWTPAVSSAVVNADGTTTAVRGFSGEQGPQVAFATYDGALITRAGSRTATVRAVAVADPAVSPPDGQLVSNVYELAGTTDTGDPVTVAPGNTIIVNLRAARATRDPVVFAAWRAGGWQQLATSQVGTDIYAASLGAFGQVALVRLDPGAVITATRPSIPAGVVQNAGAQPAGPAAGESSSVSSRTLWLSVAAAALLLASGLLLARRRAAQRAPNPPNRL